MVIVIMAGGSGTRFWPVSRMRRPKQFLTIVGDKPMIAATCDRVKQLASDDRIVLVVGEKHRLETERLFAGRAVSILAEPAGRNTAPCIGLAAKFIEHRRGNEPIAILPADHYIADEEAFRLGLRQAADIAAEGAIVTLGIVPTRPETGYGYIERDASKPRYGNAYRVKRFVEKPNLETAESYLGSPDFYWNAGIFVATPRTLLEELAVHMPSFHEGLEQLAPSFDTPRFPSALEELYERTDKISFDYAVMEKTSRQVFVIPCDCGWSDVGSWESLYQLKRPQDPKDAGMVLDGESWASDCKDCLVLSHGDRLVTALGLRNILIVDTKDALLVADMKCSQEVKKIIDYLEKKGLKDLA